MPDTPPSTLIHFVKGNLAPVCGDRYMPVAISQSHGEVTCFACRRSPDFQQSMTPTPIKLSGVMAQHPIMAEMYAAALDYTTQDEPRYRHECSDCEYLGHTNNTHSDGTIKRVELYYCHADDLGDVVARHSDGYGDWVRGYTRSTWDPDLALAVVRSIGKGLLRANALGQFNH